MDGAPKIYNGLRDVTTVCCP